MNRNDGGPAFPHPTEQDQHGQLLNHASSGMTLRDYFAAAALTGFCMGRQEKVSTFAYEAYAAADAMLKARDEDTSPMTGTQGIAP